MLPLLSSKGSRLLPDPSPHLGPAGGAPRKGTGSWAQDSNSLGAHVLGPGATGSGSRVNAWGQGSRVPGTETAPHRSGQVAGIRPKLPAPAPARRRCDSTRATSASTERPVPQSPLSPSGPGCGPPRATSPLTGGGRGRAGQDRTGVGWRLEGLLFARALGVGWGAGLGKPLGKGTSRVASREGQAAGCNCVPS